MNRSSTNLFATSLCAVLISAVVYADPASIQTVAPTTEPAGAGALASSVADPVKAISDQLRSDDPATLAQAVQQIHQLLQATPQKAVNPLRGPWLKRLLDAQRYDDVSELSLLGILATPADTAGVEQLLHLRVQALLAAGKSDQALAVAKQLFDVSTLKGTADAVRTVCQCLNAVHPDDREVLKRYRKEQIDGASVESSSTPPSSASLTLGSIQSDPTPYQPAIRAITTEDYRSLVGEGNLMLLAGDAKEAYDVFERAYTMASDKDLAAASENLARCMKAQDGTIGRANAWVLSIRPKAQLASDRSTASAFSTTQASSKE